MVNFLSVWGAIFGAVMFAAGLVLFGFFSVPKMNERFGPLRTFMAVAVLFGFLAVIALITLTP